MIKKTYKKAAEKYKPERIKTLFIAESPPVKKEGEELRYFYFDNVQKGDILLKSIMKVVSPTEYELYKNNKPYLLNLFKNKGYFLIDVCEYPINQYKHRDKFIKKEADSLIKRIKTLIDKETKIILIKKNVFQILSKRLKNEGFNIINSEHLDFPAFGNQKKFSIKLSKLLHQ